MSSAEAGISGDDGVLQTTPDEARQRLNTAIRQLEEAHLQLRSMLIPVPANDLLYHLEATGVADARALVESLRPYVDSTGLDLNNTIPIPPHLFGVQAPMNAEPDMASVPPVPNLPPRPQVEIIVDHS
ncbi:hypothetical protein HDU67_007499 [Dinochytrium kinnereticum]|nr:hypothetical protein HDU67_007499 [Dinochytrium kinnereticum]